MLRLLRSKLEHARVGVADVRLNGSAASHILRSSPGDGGRSACSFNDVDFLFLLKEPEDGNVQGLFDSIRVCFFACLLDCFPVDRRPSLGCDGGGG